MVKDSVEQKMKHIQKDSGFPSSSSEVIHLLNFNNMDPVEIPGLKQWVFDGAKSAGHIGTNDMLFLIDLEEF